MEKPTNTYIRRAMRLASEMRGVADAGEIRCDDDSCAVLFGVIRDCAYTIRNRAELEIRLHERMDQGADARKGRVG